MLFPSDQQHTSHVSFTCLCWLLHERLRHLKLIEKRRWPTKTARLGALKQTGGSGFVTKCHWSEKKLSSSADFRACRHLFAFQYNNTVLTLGNVRIVFFFPKGLQRKSFCSSREASQQNVTLKCVVWVVEQVTAWRVSNILHLVGPMLRVNYLGRLIRTFIYIYI